LFGNDHVTCSEDGQWQGNIPSCRRRSNKMASQVGLKLSRLNLKNGVKDIELFSLLRRNAQDKLIYKIKNRNKTFTWNVIN